MTSKKTQSTKSNMLSMRNVLLFWLAVILIAFFIGGIEVAGGIFIAAILSIVIWQHTLNTSWEGTITTIKTERVYRGGSDDDVGMDYKDITYAYISLTSGKTKKVQPMPGWKEGDNIKKEKGESHARKV